MKQTFFNHRKTAAFLSTVLCLSVLTGCGTPSNQPAQSEGPQQSEQQMEFPYELTIGGVGYSFAFSYDDLTFLGWESQSVKTEDAEKVLVPAGETSESSEDDAVYYKNGDIRGARPIFYNSDAENQFVTECEVEALYSMTAITTAIPPVRLRSADRMERWSWVSLHTTRLWQPWGRR